MTALLSHAVPAAADHGQGEFVHAGSILFPQVGYWSGAVFGQCDPSGSGQGITEEWLLLPAGAEEHHYTIETDDVADFDVAFFTAECQFVGTRDAHEGDVSIRAAWAVLLLAIGVNASFSFTVFDVI